MILARVHLGRGTAELTATSSSHRWQSPRVHVVADADIDNLAELRALGLKIADEASPAEIVGRAFERWGDDCARRLLGDFVFIVWEPEAQRLTWARDPLGIRSIFDKRDGHVLSVGSIAREVAGPNPEPDRLSVALFISGHHALSDGSLYKDVHVLPPAHHAVHDASSPRRLTRYWSPVIDPEIERAPERAIEELFRLTFREAVRCRMSPGAMGVEVSGGLDSSAVAACAADLSDTPPLALNLAFPGMGCDETRYSDAVVKAAGLPLVRHDATQTDVDLPSDAHPDLIFDPTVSSFAPLTRAAHERGVRVVLTGVGGDQAMDESVLECADAIRDGRFTDAATLAGITRHPLKRRGYRRLLHGGLRPLVPERWRRLGRRLRKRAVIDPLTPVMSRRSLERIHARRRAPPRPNERFGMRRELEDQSRLLMLSQSQCLGEDCGVQFRHPFLDRRLVELMMSASPRLRFQHGVTKGKPLLRRALADHLPDEVAQRTDAGEFSDFLRYVLLNRGRKRIEGIFDESRLVDLGIIDARAMREVLLSKTQTHINRLTLATGMELWLRRTWI